MYKIKRQTQAVDTLYQSSDSLYSSFKFQFFLQSKFHPRDYDSLVLEWVWEFWISNKAGHLDGMVHTTIYEKQLAYPLRGS